MIQFKLYKDQIRTLGEVDRLGLPYDKLEPQYALDKDYNGWFSFTRLCFSLGDWAVISGLPEALKIKYPKIKIALPSRKYIEQIFGHIIDQWSYGSNNPLDYIDTIFKNNPHIDYRFNPGDFDIIFTDHDRAYTDDINVPLVEQILLRFGLTPEDLNKIDSRPNLYFDKDENPNPEIKDEYGCLLFASRIDKLKGRWDDKNLIKEARKYKDTPVYYYSEFDLNDTEWDELFPVRYNLAKLSLREQLVIKSRAKFNIGYQAGINDAVSRFSNNIVLTPYDDIKENIIRGVNYIHLNGKKTKI
jgi:hypothetical protein|tara:strand:+ start:1511 stop:2413 length:903 start_codon:yes stop_codon:yes gene_type:complete